MFRQSACEKGDRNVKIFSPSGKTISTTLLEQMVGLGLLWAYSLCTKIKENGQPFLFETRDTTGNRHVDDYFTGIACNIILSWKSKYNNNLF